MATITDPPGESFRLSMLLYDTRYRSMTIQVIVLIGFLLGVGWLVNNTWNNLTTLGKTPDFGFLTQPSGYDINQTLIDYNSQSTHLRASIVGLLNTLLVAVMGCVTATVIGVLVGVLRLSQNWLVARVMTIYVEMFRNVPVLLWIVFTMAISIETLPAPRDFRGDNATHSMFLDLAAFTNRGIYLPGLDFARPVVSEPLTWLVVIVVLVASIFGVRAIRASAARKQEATGVRPSTWYLQLGTILVPLVAMFVAFGAYLDIPELKGFNFSGGLYMRNSLLALWLALSLYTAAFIAETVRGGILAISKGQTEAAAALGLRPGRIMSLVILPQALRIIIPPMISQYLNLTKNSSLAIAVGYMDLTGTLGGITLNQTGRELECLLLLMAVYLAISLTVSGVMNWYNERVKLVER